MDDEQLRIFDAAEARYEIEQLCGCVIFRPTGTRKSYPPEMLNALALLVPPKSIVHSTLARIWDASLVVGLPSDLDALSSHPRTELRRQQNRERLPSMLSDELKDWIVAGDLGLSSAAIVFHLTGYEPYPPLDPSWAVERSAHPRDVNDFALCRKLLELVPDLRGRFSEMAAVSSEWRELVKIWPDLVTAHDRDQLTRQQSATHPTGIKRDRKKSMQTDTVTPMIRRQLEELAGPVRSSSPNAE